MHYVMGFDLLSATREDKMVSKQAIFRYGEDIGSESAITPFLGISFNNSELRDGKLSVSGFMDVLAGTFLAPLMGTDQRFMS